jgi:hypothetical protein
MTITQFEDIAGYYDESLPKRESLTVKTLGEILAIDETPAVRWPVRNREPREPISAHKRAGHHPRTRRRHLPILRAIRPAPSP